MVRQAESIMDCPDIHGIWKFNSTIVNGNVTTNDVTLSQSDNGPYIHVLCPEGAHVVGPTMITCLQNGEWDDLTKPSCSTSTSFGIHQSDIILISVLAVSGALVIMGLTIVLTHLLCFKNKNKTPSLSQEGLDRSSESNVSSSPYYIDDKFTGTISSPTSVTLNGHPLAPSYHSNQPTHHFDRSSFQTRSMERRPVVLSYNTSTQNDQTFSLPRYFVTTTNSCRYPNITNYPNTRSVQDVQFGRPYPNSQTLQELEFGQSYPNPQPVQRVHTTGRRQYYGSERAVPAYTKVRKPQPCQQQVFHNQAYTNDETHIANVEQWQQESTTDEALDYTMDSFSTEASDYYANVE